MFRTIVTWGVAGVVFLAMHAARGALCEMCVGQVCIATEGKCSACGKATGSGALTLCPACSEKQGRCEHCLALHEPGKLPPSPKAADSKSNQPDSRPKKVPSIDMKKSGHYLAGLWQYEMDVTAPGTREESRVGRLAYAEHRATPAEINDFHQTPWGPIYWVGKTKGPGEHGWMPRPADRVDRKGRLLPLPGNGPKLRELNEADDGKTVEAAVGTRIFVRLRGNPTTGYQWQFAKKPDPALTPLGDAQYAPDRQAPVAIGAGGTFTFSFRAVRPGAATVRLVYVRPWEKDKPPEQTFTLAVQVVATSETPAER